MKTQPTHHSTFPLLPATAAAIAFALAAPASAGTLESSVFTEADVDLSGELSLGEFTTTLDLRLNQRLVLKKFKDADLNLDLQIDLDEYLIFTGLLEAPPKWETEYGNLDQDDEDGMSLEEYADSLPGRRPLGQIRKMFLAIDTDADGSLSLDEWEAYRTTRLPKGPKYTLFELADLDDDGELTIDEYAALRPQGFDTAKLAKQFDKADRDGDGVVIASEFKSSVSLSL